MEIGLIGSRPYYSRSSLSLPHRSSAPYFDVFYIFDFFVILRRDGVGTPPQKNTQLSIATFSKRDAIKNKSWWAAISASAIIPQNKYVKDLRNLILAFGVAAAVSSLYYRRYFNCFTFYLYIYKGAIWFRCPTDDVWGTSWWGACHDEVNPSVQNKRPEMEMNNSEVIYLKLPNSRSSL